MRLLGLTHYAIYFMKVFSCLALYCKTRENSKHVYSHLNHLPNIYKSFVELSREMYCRDILCFGVT